MILIVSRTLLLGNFKGLSLWPFVIVKSAELKKDKLLIHHEKIHLRQQIEMLVLLFYVWYLLEFGIRFLISGNFKLAYRTISFEREAYACENNKDYLAERPFWAFLKFL